jgi:hypothetical protein
MPVIEVFRNKGSRDVMRRYRVIIDGREVGRLRQRETGRYQVEPGHHKLTIRIDWCSSRTASVDLGGQETVRFSCQPTGGLWSRPSLFVHKDQYITLERESASTDA